MSDPGERNDREVMTESSPGSEHSGDPRNAGNGFRILKGCQRLAERECRLASLQDAINSQSDFRGSATPGYSLRSLRDQSHFAILQLPPDTTP